VGDIPASNMVTIHLPPSEENQQAVLYVVASCSGAVLTSNPFTAEPLGVRPGVFVRRPKGLFTFLSGNCTLEDNESVKITPSGECLEAEAMIGVLEETRSVGSAEENVWIRRTPAQGDIAFQKPEDAAKLTITENTCTFREVGPSGESLGNTVTWTTPPERMIDEGTLAPLIEKCKYQG